MADVTALTFAFLRSHPAEAARVLEAAPTAESVDLLSQVPARIGGAVLGHMLPRSSAEVLAALPLERALELLSELDAQHGVAILRHVDSGLRQRMLAGLPTATALTAKLLLEFIDDAVGACMNPDIVALAGNVRAEEALDRVRHSNAAVDRIYVIDDNRRLLGWAALSALMRAPVSARLESLMNKADARLAAHAPLSGAHAHPGWQSASVLPVVDRRDRLLGDIAHDALGRAAQRLQPASPEDASVAGTLVHGYWQSISGILELLTSILPPSRPIGSSPHER